MSDTLAIGSHQPNHNYESLLKITKFYENTKQGRAEESQSPFWLFFKTCVLCIYKYSLFPPSAHTHALK